jgi:hypothetical protein
MYGHISEMKVTYREKEYLVVHDTDIVNRVISEYHMMRR